MKKKDKTPTGKQNKKSQSQSKVHKTGISFDPETWKHVYTGMLVPMINWKQRSEDMSLILCGATCLLRSKPAISLSSKLSSQICLDTIRMVGVFYRTEEMDCSGWADGKTILLRRKSPKKGRLEDLFSKLVYIPTLVKSRNFSLEVLLIHCEETLINDGQGSWRRKGWSIYDRRLLDIVSRVVFSSPSDFHALLPATLSKIFTSRDLTLPRRWDLALTRVGRWRIAFVTWGQYKLLENVVKHSFTHVHKELLRHTITLKTRASIQHDRPKRV